MGIDVKTLAAAKSYVKESLQGGGAIQGLPGKDGFSPIVTTKQTENGTEISIQDSTHTETFTIKNVTNVDGTKDYEGLKNKPSINDVTLEKNKTFEDLGMIPLSNMEIMQIISKATNQ